nr:MAG TPA: hypothetical protein [Caudoviricetes sp.]
MKKGWSYERYIDNLSELSYNKIYQIKRGVYLCQLNQPYIFKKKKIGMLRQV